MLSTWNVHTSILTVEFAVDLDNGLNWGQAIVLYSSPVADIFHLKEHWAAVWSCFGHVK